MTKLKVSPSYILFVLIALVGLITTVTRRKFNNHIVARRNLITPCDGGNLPPHAAVNYSDGDDTDHHRFWSAIPPVLQDYAVTHARLRTCLAGRQCADRDGHERPPRALIWKCQTELCGGLGDRVRGIRLIFLLAVALDYVFFLDWPINSRVDDSFPLTSVLKPHAIDWRVPEHLLANRSAQWMNDRVRSVKFKQPRSNVLYNPFRPIPAKRSKEKYPDDQLFPIRDANFTDLFDPYDVVFISNRIQRSSVITLLKNPNHPNLVRLHKELTEMAKKQSTTAKHIVDQLLTQYLFMPTPVVESAIASRVFDGSPYVAVHARTGMDMQERTSARLRRVQETNLSFLAERMLKCIARSTSDEQLFDTRQSKHLFIASDSQELKSKFSSRARQFGWEVHYEHEVVYHIDLADERSRSERCSAFVNVFADVFALARAHTLVHLHSGFASTALDFGNISRSVELDIDSDVDDLCKSQPLPS